MLCEVRFLSGHFRANMSLYASVQFKSAFFLQKSPPTASLPYPQSLSFSWKRLPESFNTLLWEGSASITLYMSNSTKIPSSRCTLHRQPQELYLLLLGISENYSPLSLPFFLISLSLRVLFTQQLIHWGNTYKSNCTQGCKKDPPGLDRPFRSRSPSLEKQQETIHHNCTAVAGNQWKHNNFDKICRKPMMFSLLGPQHWWDVTDKPPAVATKLWHIDFLRLGSPAVFLIKQKV